MAIKYLKLFIKRKGDSNNEAFLFKLKFVAEIFPTEILGKIRISRVGHVDLISCIWQRILKFFNFNIRGLHKIAGQGQLLLWQACSKMLHKRVGFARNKTIILP